MADLNHKEQWQKIVVKNETYIYDERFPLLSIHLASIRPIQFREFVENIHGNCVNKNAYEIIVKIDTEDTAMIACVNELGEKYGTHKVKALVGARKEGPWSLWEFYNDIFHLSHKKAYFLWLPSDEVRIMTPGWDQVLAKYIGFYKDNIFRLKLSENRLRNFYNFHEVLGTPDNFPFITKKWMDLCNLWGDCHSPDLFQQAVSYYLGKKNVFRDIPIFDIELTGIEAGLLIPPAESYSRTQNIRRLWRIALSKQMCSRYIAHAAKIHFFIESCHKQAKIVCFNERISYPSKVICTNDVGMKKKIICKQQTIFLYSYKLLYQYTISRVKKAIKLIIKTFYPVTLALTKTPIMFAMLLISGSILLFFTPPFYMRLAILILLCISIFKLNANQNQ